MVTFPVSDVALAKGPLKVLNREQSLRSILQARVEQLSSGAPLVICDDLNPFAAAAHRAFFDHRPLVISPDAVWFCIAQGFVQHVAQNAERLRHRFVQHEGKLKLVVERRDFFLGQSNPWPEAFAAFSELIAGHVGKVHALLTPSFSTTGPSERAAFDVLVMDAFQAYFEYEMRTGCGIPSITLLGTPDDWRSLRHRAAGLGEYELSSWINVLLPVLDEIVATVEGRVDSSFWKSFFRYESSSGGSELTGWIQLLFPFLVKYEVLPAPERKAPRPPDASGEIRLLTDEEVSELKREMHERTRRMLVLNPYLANWRASYEAAEARGNRRGFDERPILGPSLGEIPSGLASAPLKFVDVRDGSTTPLRLVGGLFGVTQDPASGALQAEFGWAVTYEAQPGASS